MEAEGLSVGAGIAWETLAAPIVSSHLELKLG